MIQDRLFRWEDFRNSQRRECTKIQNYC